MSNMETNWEAEGYNKYLTDQVNPSGSGYMTASDFNAQVQDNSITTIKIAELSANKIVSGILYSTDLKTYFDLDGKRMIINDGTNDRVLLGYLAGGF